MSFQQTAGQISQSGLTSRDVLIGVLLALEDSPQYLDSDGNEQNIELLHRLIRELCAAVDPIRVLPRIGYGLPSWLIGQVSPPSASGLGAFLHRLVDRSHGWRSLFNSVAADLTYDDLSAIFDALRASVARTPKDSFGRLRDESVISLEGTLLEGSLAAAAGVAHRTRSYLDEVARSAYQSEDVLKRELGARLRRTDIAIVARKQPSSGVILGADIQFDSGGASIGVSVPGMPLVRSTLAAATWSPVDESFIEGLSRGRLAAIELLRTVGADSDILDQLRGVSVEIRGILPPTVLTDQSAGLPLALTILSRLANLAMPRVVASGSFDSQARIEAMLPAMVAAKSEAVRIDGLNEGLLVYSPATRPTTGLLLLPDNTLASACVALWGHKWDAWAAAMSSRALQKYGFQEGWRNGVRPEALVIDGQPVVVHVPQAEVLARHFSASAVPTVAFLGGPAQSGKTWIAQEVDQRLSSTGKWQVLVLTPTEGFPTVDTLVPTVRMLIQQKQLQRPVLVILDGLEWEDDAEDFERDLFELKDTLGVSVLAVIRSDDTSDWETEQALNQGAVMGEARLREFTTGLVKAHPHFANAAAALGTVRRGAGGNLWWLVRLADIAARTPTARSYGQLLGDYYATNFTGVSQPGKRDVTRLAALSYADLGSPSWFLGDAHEDLFRRLGAHRNKSGDWRLSSRAACESLLALSQGKSLSDTDIRAGLDVVPTLIAQFVRAGIGQDRRDEVVWAFQRLRRSDEDLLTRVLQFVSDDIDLWANSFESPIALARLFDTIQEGVSEKLRLRLARWLVKLLTLRMSSVSAGELAKCLNLLRQHRFLLEHESQEDDLWAPLVDGIEANIGEVLRSPASAKARTSLVRALWRMHDEKSHGVLLRNADRLLKAQDSIGAADFRLALEFTELNTKSLTTPVDPRLVPALTELAECKIGVGDGMLSYVSRLLLRLQLDLEQPDWDNLARRFQKDLPGALSKSSPLEVSATLRLLGDFNRALAVKLFTKGNLTNSLIRLFGAANASEAATLIATLARVHGQTAREVLYLDDHPRSQLAGALATRIQQGGDGKGAGRLLKATLIVDSNFGTIHDGFARAVADALGPGFFEAQFIVNPQTSVLLHLLNGMIGAGVGFSELIRETALHGVVRNIQSNYNEWPPRLALFLVANSEWGDWFASSLASQLSDRRLLDVMTRARNTDALGAFHELGCFLRPAITKQFAAEPHERVFAVLYRAERPEVMTRAARAFAQTLRRSGERMPGKTILERLKTDWSKQLARASTAGDLAEAIRGLSYLDRETAAAAVATSLGLLARRVQRGLQQLPQTGVELLDAIEEAAPGSGKRIVSELARSSGAWNSVMEQIAYEQNPQFQGTTFHMLAELGGMPKERVRQRVFDQWLTRIHTLSTPAGILALLRAFAAWNEDYAVEAARKVNIGRIAARMSHGAAADLDRAEALIGALFCAGGEAAGQELIDSLKQLRELPRRLGLNHVARLLSGLEQWDPAFGARLLEEARGLAVEKAQSQFVLDDVPLWLDIGWIACNAELFGARLSISQAPWSFLLPHSSQVTAWGAGWLEEQWAALEVDRTLQVVLREGPPHQPWAAAAVLTVASRTGKVQDLIESATWDHVSDSTPYHLEALLRAGQTDPRLMEFLAKRLPDIRNRVALPHLRLHPARRRIETLLREMETLG